MINELFKAIDSKDPQAFSSLLAAECRFCFGNMPAVDGVDQIRDFVAGFFDSIDSLTHEIKDSWAIPGGVVCHGLVSYTRHNGTVLSVPFANILMSNASGITDYQIFADTSQLY